MPPPPPGVGQLQNYGVTVSGEVSTDGGASYQPFSAPASAAVQVTSTKDTGSTRFFDTEMLSMTLSGGTLPGGVMVRDCRLGAHCSIAQSTEIMAGTDGGSPTIGDRVWMGAHAKIIGAFQIGGGSTISAGSVVRRDLPERALYMGNPGRIVMRDYDNSAMLGLGS